MSIVLNGTTGVTTPGVSALTYQGNISNTSVLATGTTTSRSLQDRFADVINVKDFGAKGDGVTDDAVAIQAAINYAVNTFRSKNIFVPAGRYLLMSPILFPDNSISGAGIVLFGEGNNGWGSMYNGTEFLVGHISGPAFKLRAGGQSIRSAVIRSIGSRLSNNDYNSDNWGILIEAPDEPGFVGVASASIHNVTVTFQPSNGIVASGNVFQLYLEQVASVNNKGHGFVFDCGAITNRVNRVGQIGGAVLQNVRSFGNKGHSIVAGLGNSTAHNRNSSFQDLTTQTTLGAYRILIADGDLDFTQSNGNDIQHADGTTLYGFKAGYNSIFFGRNFTCLNTAWGGAQSTPLVALHLFGQHMNFINNRFIQCGGVATIKAMNSASYNSTGYSFENCYIYNDDPADMTTAIVGQSTGANVVKNFTWHGELPSGLSLSSGINNRIYSNSDGLFLQGAGLSTGNGAQGNVRSGTYTPTITNVTNVNSSTAHVLQYLQVGSTVTVSGRVTVTPTAASGTQTTLGISLPIASNFSTATSCAGAAVYLAPTGSSSTYARIQADVTDDRAQFDFNANITNIQDFYMTFTYRII